MLTMKRTNDEASSERCPTCPPGKPAPVGGCRPVTSRTGVIVGCYSNEYGFREDRATYQTPTDPIAEAIFASPEVVAATEAVAEAHTAAEAAQVALAHMQERQRRAGDAYDRLKRLHDGADRNFGGAGLPPGVDPEMLDPARLRAATDTANAADAAVREAVLADEAAGAEWVRLNVARHRAIEAARRRFTDETGNLRV